MTTIKYYDRRGKLMKSQLVEFSNSLTNMWKDQIRSVKRVDQRVNSNFYPIDRSHFIRRTDVKLRVFNANRNPSY